MSSPLNANLPTPLMPSSQQLQTGSTNSTTTLPDATNNISNNNSQPASKNEIFAQNVQQSCVSSQSTPSLSTNGGSLCIVSRELKEAILDEILIKRNHLSEI